MTEFLIDFNTFFTMFLDSLTRLATFISTSIVGKIILYTALILVIVKIIIIIIKGVTE